jgi:predicted nucleic acid-binding protein
VAEVNAAGVVVCDAGPLIHLDQLGCLDLLSDFALVQIPDAVWREVDRHRPEALRRRSPKRQRVTDLPKASAELIQLAQAFLLDAGELEALRLMQVSPDAMLLTDDAAARLVAERLEYEVHGTIGIIVRAWRRQQRTKRQVLNLLRAVPRRSTLFIRARLLESIIDEIRTA